MMNESNLQAPEFILPDSVLEDIFVRLPTTAAACCKCVSKRWNALVSSLERSALPNRTMFITETTSESEVFPRHNGDIVSICHNGPSILSRIAKPDIVVGVCGGLICLSSIDTGDHVSVLNPAIRLFSVVSFNSEPVELNKCFFFGFGYGTRSQGYQVVKISQSATDTTIEICKLCNPLEAKTLTLQSASVPFLLTNAAPITLHVSSQYWIALSLKNQNLEIVMFDMETESFTEIPFSCRMPNVVYNVEVRGTRSVAEHPHRPELHIDGMAFRLGIFQKNICLLATQSSKVEIWSLKMSTTICWTKEFERETSSRMRTVLGFTANDELVLRNDDNTLFAYDIHRRRSVCPLTRRPYHQVVTYKETSIMPVRN